MLESKKVFKMSWNFTSFTLISFVCNLIFAVSAELIFVQLLNRHGDRYLTDIEKFKNDPYKDYFSKDEYGMLTKMGKLRAFNLGTFLHKKYSNFLGTVYIPGSIHAQSSDVPRTKETLQIILNTLYSEASIPATYDSMIKDSLFFPQACVKYVRHYVNARIRTREELKRLNDFMEDLSEWTGKSIRSSLDMYLIYMALETENHLNLTLPDWTKGVYPSGDLFNGTVLEYETMNYNQDMRRINGGMMLGKFMENIKSIINSSMNNNEKLMIYSAHDLNIVSLQYALNVYKPHVPEFASAMIAELHLTNQSYFVKVLYYHGESTELEELTIPGCDTLCPFETFLNLTTNAIPSGSDFICQQIRNVAGSAKDTTDGVFQRIKHLFFPERK